MTAEGAPNHNHLLSAGGELIQGKISRAGTGLMPKCKCKFHCYFLRLVNGKDFKGFKTEIRRGLKRIYPFLDYAIASRGNQNDSKLSDTF
jgi:hypothetical protein